jgi:putative transposase
MQELSGVSEAARDRALARFRRSLQQVASDANLSFRTAQRWVSQYRRLGLAAFVRKAREDRGALGSPG